MHTERIAAHRISHLKRILPLGVPNFPQMVEAHVQHYYVDYYRVDEDEDDEECNMYCFITHSRNGQNYPI